MQSAKRYLKKIIKKTGHLLYISSPVRRFTYWLRSVQSSTNFANVNNNGNANNNNASNSNGVRPISLA